MSDLNSSRQPRHGIRSRVLLGTAAAALVVGGLAGGAVMDVRTPAYAEPVRVQSQAQLPNFADLVDKVKPAVVSVRVKSEVSDVSDEDGGNGMPIPNPGQFPPGSPMERFFKQFQDQQNGLGKRPQMRKAVGLGSGFFISEDGYLVTNNHVVDGSSDFTITDSNGKEYTARLIGTDPKTDLALLKVDAPEKFTYVEFSPGTVRVGEWVVAVGNPFGLGGTVTAGIVSARGRDIGAGPYDDFLQIDASVNRGNSGGPTFNLNGQVVGINTAIFSPSGGNVGIAFAIPASVAKGVVADLMKDGKVDRGWLGVQIQPVSRDIADSLGLADAAGALVVEPQADSPGAKAGIKKGDVITALDGEPIKDPRDLARRVADIAPGKKVDLSVWRDGKSETIAVEIGTLAGEQIQAATGAEEAEPEAPASEQALADLGITVTPDDKGLVVSSVDPDSDASDRGLKQGDYITSVNNQPVKSADDVVKVLDGARKDGRSKALFQIETNDGSRFLALPIDQG